MHSTAFPTTFVNLPHQIDGKINNFVKELSMEGEVREAVLRKYDELRLTHPELPSQLRDFQVTCATSWRFWVTTCCVAGWHTCNCTWCQGGGAPNVCSSYWIWKEFTDDFAWSPHAWRWMTKSWNFVIVWTEWPRTMLFGAESDLETQVSSSHYMNTSLTAPDWNADCHLVPNLWSAIAVLKCIKLIYKFKFRSSYLYAISNFRGKSHPADSAVYMWSRDWEILTTCRWRW